MFFLPFLLLVLVSFAYDNFTAPSGTLSRGILLKNPFSESRTYLELKRSSVRLPPPKPLPVLPNVLGVVKVNGNFYVAVQNGNDIILLRKGDKYNGFVIKEISETKVIFASESGLVREVKLE